MISSPPRAGHAESLISPLEKPKVETKIQADKGSTSFAKLIQDKSAEKSATTKKPEVKLGQGSSTSIERSHPPATDGGKIEGGARKIDNLSVKKESSQGPQAPDKVGELKTPGPQPVVNDISKHEELRSPMLERESLPEASEKLSTMKSQAPMQMKTQTQVMQEFMDSMENEFSIPPTRIVEAMTDLEPEELLQTAEDSSSQFIKKLDLTPEQEQRAQAMYMSMLAKLSTLDRSPALKNVSLQDAMANGHLQQKMMVQAMLVSKVKQEGIVDQDGNRVQWIALSENEKQQVKDMLGKQAENLLMGPPPPPLSGEEILDARAELLAQALQKDAELEAMMPEAMATPGMVPVTMNDWNPAAMSTLPLRPAPSAVAQGYQDMSQANTLQPTLAPNVQETSVLNSASLKTKPLGLEEVRTQNLGTASLQNSSSDAGVLSKLAVKPNSSGSHSQLNDQGGSGGQSAGQGNPDSLAQGSMTPLNANAQSLPQESLKQGAFAGALAGAGVAGAHSAQSKDNVQQVIQQAQYVLKKGGGDAVVKMNSEALGDVHLKVSVADGRVNVQMSTATREAKDLLEASMKDLKNSIGAHNLKIDHIKVDVGNNSSETGRFAQKDPGSQFQGHSQKSPSQNLGSEGFANSSRQGGREPNRSDVRGPDEIANLESLRSVGRSARSASQRYVGQGRGTGLNLVA